MAHNLNFNEQTGKYSFFSVKQTAWHSLGQTVQDYPTSREAIAHAGLDYEVVKAPLFAKGTEPAIDFAVPDQYATMRTDTNAVFGVVGRDYHIVQNADAFAFFDAIVGGGDGILYETAGAIGQGERIFITAKLPGFGAYNAVTGYYQNVRNFKSDEDKMKSIYLGGTAQARAQKAFDLCTDFAKSGAAALHLN